MNKKSTHRDALLADVFSHDDFAAGPAAAFARTAARHARHRRLARNLLITAGTTAAFAAVFARSLLHHHAPPHSSEPPSASDRGYEIISDTQLLALVNDRPLLFIPRDNGTGEIVLLED